MIISQTPLRISFVGGGTDLREFYGQAPGMVLSSAIDKYIYVIIKERFDDRIVLHYTGNEIVERVYAIRHDLIREALRLTGIERGVEIITLADIPSTGSGLGSSSTVTVGLLNALHAFKGEQVSAEQLAREAVRIEVETLHKPIGKQDQYIAAYGGLRKFIFHPDDTVETASIPLQEADRLMLGARLFLHFTNLTRNADDILTEQKRNTPDNLAFLQRIAGLVPRLEAGLRERRFDLVGELLRENWELKEQLAQRISNPEIAAMVAQARQSGATGCKIAGAGGGGFLMSYVPADHQEQFLAGMTAYRNMPFALEPFGSRLLLNIRRETRFSV
jgi:D-glycero-alpha-D-manno-heptose-7-phosphate kinase